MNLEKIEKISGGLIGLEREALRVKDNFISPLPHPKSLGNVYTHPNITIDYAECLLEFVSNTHSSPEAVYKELLDLHRYAYKNLEQGEKLWAVSMPCQLPENPEHIEIGYFGTSNSGKIKRLYRTGLSYRYGRPMQMIAGVHFNYSPPQQIWSSLALRDKRELNQELINDYFMAQLRNIARTGWIICYLFGASPAVDISFSPALGVLDKFSDKTLGWKNATSLRMSQLGYQNKVDFSVSLNNLDEYINDLISAVLTPSPIYEYLGIKDLAGNYRQTSPNILQIENEYYASARPKRPPKKGEAPTLALARRGILYTELRLLDCNPYDPAGISLEQIRFLEIYMLYCLLKPSEELHHAEINESNHNRLRVACCGNCPNLKLFKNNKEILLKDYGLKILNEMLVVAEKMDKQGGNDLYQRAIKEQIAVAKGERLNFSSRVKTELENQEFIGWAKKKKKKHEEVLTQPLEKKVLENFNNLRDKSLQDFAELEEKAKGQIDFDEYLNHYFDEIKKFREFGI